MIINKKTKKMKKEKRENLLVLLKQTAIKQKKFLATFFCVAIFFALDAQSMLFDGSSVRLSYTQYTGVHGGSTPVVAQTDIAKYHNWAVTCDADLLQLGKGFSLGAHVGMTPTTYMVSSTSEIKKMMGFHYGVDLRCHILQLAGVEDRHWDVYGGMMLGSYVSRHVSPKTEYALSVGVGYYPTNHLGVVLEYGWGNYVYVYKDFPGLTHSSVQGKLGLSYRF